MKEKDNDQTGSVSEVYDECLENSSKGNDHGQQFITLQDSSCCSTTNLRQVSFKELHCCLVGSSVTGEKLLTLYSWSANEKRCCVLLTWSHIGLGTRVTYACVQHTERLFYELILARHKVWLYLRIHSDNTIIYRNGAHCLLNVLLEIAIKVDVVMMLNK